MHKHPDILLILANRHRRDYTGAGGGQLVHTPHIDRLAAEGGWFDKAATIFPAPGPSRMSILSGRYPAADAAPVTLAESPLGRCLAAAGYALTEITPAPGPEGLRRTAERARDALAGGTGPRFTLVTLPELDGETDDLPAEVLDLYRGKGIPLAMHHAAVTACDRAVGQILDALAATGRAGTTAVIYSSVVGDQFKFRDAVNRGGHTCYDDCIRVPLVIRGPGGPAGVRLAQIVGLHDLAPTIAAMAGADLADADGESLLPLMAGRPTAWRRALYIHNRHLRHIAVTFEAEKGRAYYGTFPPWDQRAIWTGRHKLILSFDKGRHSLFDTCIDPEEEFDLFGAPHRRTPMDELTRFKDTMPLVRELAQEMAALAERVGDRAGADLAREIARSADPLHRPAGTPFHHL